MSHRNAAGLWFRWPILRGTARWTALPRSLRAHSRHTPTSGSARVSNPAPRMTTAPIPVSQAASSRSSMYRLRHNILAQSRGSSFPSSRSWIAGSEPMLRRWWRSGRCRARSSWHRTPRAVVSPSYSPRHRENRDGCADQHVVHGRGCGVGTETVTGHEGCDDQPYSQRCRDD
jgi:hypothetical protein